MPELPNLETAIQQLAEFFGFQAHYDFTHDGVQYRITYRQFLAPEIEKKLEEVDKFIQGCDRAEVTLPNGKKITGSVPAIPLQKDGKILDDGKDARMLIAMWGEDTYRGYEKAGGTPGILSAVWAMMDAKHEEWRKAGSKSASGN